MTGTASVSVLMTVYNREKYISKAIESVLKSSYKDFELIIVDDCSTDNSFQIAEDWQKKDERIRLFRNPANLGQFANRNKAIQLANTELIKFLDSDDEIVENGLEIMIKSISFFPDAGIAVPGTENDPSLPVKLSPHDSVALHYKGNNHLCFGPTGTIFTKKALTEAGLFEPGYGILADTLLNLKVASLYATVFFQPGLFYWRRHDEQITDQQKDDVRMIGERYRIMEASMNYSQLPLNKKEIKTIRNNFTKINTRHFLSSLLKGRIKDAFAVRSGTAISIGSLLRAVLKK